MSDVERIKERLDIREIVGSYIELQQAGKSYKARCPFHNEKTASFNVSPDKEMYYCFGCGRGGDIFSFVQEIEGLDFAQALKLLADKAGITLSNTSSHQQKKRMQLYRLLDDVAKFYEIQLRRDQESVGYLESRGVTKETMAHFRLGRAPQEWDKLAAYLQRKKYDHALGKEAGLLIDGKKSPYDRFRDRIMFPIADGQGRIVAFSGRLTKHGEQQENAGGKYINSPDGDLYDKSTILYGYDRAKQAMKEANVCIVVEGQLDLILAHQAGFTHTVAVSGTALTDTHLNLIKRFTNNIILAFDADRAGYDAVRRSTQNAYQQGMNVRVIQMPEGKDPADIIKEDAREWKKMVAQAIDYVEFQLDLLRKQNADIDELEKLVKSNLYPVLGLMSRPIVRDNALQRVAQVLGIGIEAVREDFLIWRQKNISALSHSPAPVAKKVNTVIDPRKIFLLIAAACPEGSDIEPFKKRFDALFGEHAFEKEFENQSTFPPNYQFHADMLLENTPSYLTLIEDLLIKLELHTLSQKRDEIAKKLHTAHSEETPLLLEEFDVVSKQIDTLQANRQSS